MKVRIVKCEIETFWYSDQIGSIFNVDNYDESRFNLIGGELKSFCINKQDCEILEADEPKPDPFDLDRALKGEKVISRNGLEVNQIVRFEIDEPYKIYGVIQGKLYAFNLDGTWHGTISTSPYDLFMAPRKPEYQTVWVNFFKDVHTNKIFTNGHVFINREEALNKDSFGKYGSLIGTFPITFKKP